MFRTKKIVSYKQKQFTEKKDISILDITRIHPFGMKCLKASTNKVKKLNCIFIKQLK